MAAPKMERRPITARHLRWALALAFGLANTVWFAAIMWGRLG